MKLFLLYILVNFSKSYCLVTKNDSILAENYFYRAKSLSTTEKRDSSNYYYTLSAKLFEQLANQKNEQLPKQTIRHYWDKFFLCHNNIAWSICIYDADYESAFQLLNEKMKFAEEIMGYESLSVARFLDRLGMVTSYMGRYAESLQYYQKSLQILDKTEDDGRVSYKALVYNNVGMLHVEFGNYDLAWNYLNKSLSIRIMLYGEKNNLVATNYANMATVLRIKGDYYTAQDFDRKALGILLNIFGGVNLNVALIYNNMGNNYMSLKEYDESLKNYIKSLEIKKKLLGEEHPEIGVLLTNIANTYYLLNDYETSLDYHLKAVDIQVKTFTPYHLALGRSYTNIGLLYMDRKEYKQSLIYLDKSMEVFNTSLSMAHPQKGIIYYSYARLYNIFGASDSALFYCNQAIKQTITDPEKVDVYMNPSGLQVEFATKQSNLIFISDPMILLETLKLKAGILEQRYTGEL